MTCAHVSRDVDEAVDQFCNFPGELTWEGILDQNSDEGGRGGDVGLQYQRLQAT